MGVSTGWHYRTFIVGTLDFRFTAASTRSRVPALSKSMKKLTITKVSNLRTQYFSMQTWKDNLSKKRYFFWLNLDSFLYFVSVNKGCYKQCALWVRNSMLLIKNKHVINFILIHDLFVTMKILQNHTQIFMNNFDEMEFSLKEENFSKFYIIFW